MSQWTHVNSVIRFNAARVLGMGLPDLGQPPYGSEGELDISIWVNPNANSLAGYTVSIFGDLRDYSDSSEILDYFNKLTKGQMVRSGLLEIEVEGKEKDVYYIHNTDRWQKLIPF